MKAGGSRRKGSGFEREVANKLNASLADLGFEDEACYRTPQSGGHHAIRKTDPGDIMIGDRLLEHFPFSVECKNDKRLNLHHFWEDLQFRKGAENDWLAQAVRAAENQNRFPLLVCKSNRTPTYAAAPAKILMQWYPPMFEGREDGSGYPQMVFRYNDQVWALIRFDDLLIELRRRVTYILSESLTRTAAGASAV